MKKSCLGCTGLFSLLAIFSGGFTVLTGSSDNILTDILLILFFICLGIGSLYFFAKNKTKKIEEETNEQHDNSYALDSNRPKTETNNNPVVIEKELESERIQKENELLKMKLDLKEQYIKEIEQKSSNKINGSLDLSYTKARTLTDTFVVLDFETTGLKYNENEIIQYGIVEYEKGKIINEHTEYFKPDTPISKRIERITGITNEFLEDKPKLDSSKLEYLHKLICGKTLVAHNAPFDMKFLLYQFYLNEIKHEKFRVIDTLTFSRKLIKETPNHKLQTLKEHFNLDDGDSHNALNDCRATGNLLILLMNR